MPMPMRCKFSYGATNYSPSLPPRAWDPADETVGGVEIAAAGAPTTYVVRRDDLLEVTLRFPEAEWDDVLALVTYGQTGQVIQWFANVDVEPDYSEGVYLHAPAPGERWKPTRGQFPRTFEVTLTLRGALGGIPWTPYYTT